MKKLYVLCFVTLAAVFVDVVFFRSATVSAQAPSQYKVQRTGPVGYFFNPGGTIVGFSCVHPGNTADCYVLTAQ